MRKVGRGLKATPDLRSKVLSPSGVNEKTETLLPLYVFYSEDPAVAKHGIASPFSVSDGGGFVLALCMSINNAIWEN